MKQPKKLTRELKEAVAAYGLAVEQWSFFRSGNGMLCQNYPQENEPDKNYR